MKVPQNPTAASPSPSTPSAALALVVIIPVPIAVTRLANRASNAKGQSERPYPSASAGSMN